MLVISTLAILITSIDRVILPTVLPAILEEFGLNKTQGGILNPLSFAGILSERSCSGCSATPWDEARAGRGPGRGRCS
jgi:hypothetical protein